MKNLEILWESVTGVRTEDPAPFLRIISFIVLVIGIIWAVFNYYRTVKIADLYQTSYSENTPVITAKNDSEMTKLANNVRAIISMRQGGRILAASINDMNRRLFNDDINYSAENSPETNLTMRGNSEELRVTVKAILLSGRERIAVIDLPNSRGVIIRQGVKIPEINARVLRINKDSVMLNVNGKNLLASFNEATKTDEQNNSPASVNIKSDNAAIPIQSSQEVLK